MRLSDYIADFFAKRAVADCFTVVGGGSMFLNDSLGHSEAIKCTYFHHEQAAAMAAESYARYSGKVAPVCVTTGPGGTNTLTGVLGAWLDSIPMMVISGQVRYDTTSRYESGLLPEGFPNLRSLGDQEFDITKAASAMTKYAVLIEDPATIRYHMEKAWHLMTTGRPGPVWVDIPVNFQSADIDPESLKGYDPESEQEPFDSENLGTVGIETLSDQSVKEILDRLLKAERPVIYAGGGVRISGGYDLFRQAVDRLGVPVCTYWNSIDLMEDEHPLYCGRGGNMGNRPGNFAIQNADLVLVLGSRLSIRQVGYNYENWAPHAEVIMVDIDPAEMLKHTIHAEHRICGDVKQFLELLLAELDRRGSKDLFCRGIQSWREQCLKWKNAYPVVAPEQLLPKSDKTEAAPVNVYGFIRTLSEALPEDSRVAVSNGACCVAGHQAWYVKKGTRFIINNAVASMGYGLPAAIGLCIASGGREIICLEGDGSIMMNLQELQTVINLNLPIIIYIINNGGYHSIRLTQRSFFGDKSPVGIGPESGDLSFPVFRDIAGAFGYDYYAVATGKELSSQVDTVLKAKAPLICEVFTDKEQPWSPKSTARMQPDGTMVSLPLDDMAPLLPREEYRANALYSRDS